MSDCQISVINGVQITVDGDTMHFEPIDMKEPSAEKIPETEKLPWYKKFFNWLKNGKVTPYVKVRDAADPFGDRTDIDAGSDGRNGIEAGIKIRF